MKKATIGIVAAVLVVVIGIAVWHKSSKKGAESQGNVQVNSAANVPSADGVSEPGDAAETQADSVADKKAATESEPKETGAPAQPDAAAREASTQSVSEVVVTKQQDSADSKAVVKAIAVTSPSSGAKLSADEASAITFRWTPLVPKPQEPAVKYRLRVWQLMQGQNGTSAMKSNQPVVTRNLSGETEVSLSGIYTGPCKPPYLCDFVWGVAAVNADGSLDESTSATGSFSVKVAETTDEGTAAPADGSR